MKKADRMLLMIAACGEMPAGAAVWVAGSPSYTAALITRLKREGKIGVKNAGRLKGYVLYRDGCSYLWEKYPGPAACLPGTEGKPAKGDREKRLRLHRMGQAQCWLYSRGVRIGQGGVVLPDTCHTGEDALGEYIPSIYLKRHLAKEAGGSRACGVWVSGENAFCVYNTMDSLMRWSARTEWCFAVRTQQYLESMGMGKPGMAAGQGMQAVILGNGMAVAAKLLSSDGGIKKQLFCLDDTYRHYYFIPMQPEAGLQLALLADREKQRKLEGTVGQLLQLEENGDFTCAGKDRGGCPVCFAWLSDLWQVQRMAGRIMREGQGKVVCLDYQAGALKEYFGPRAEVMGLNREKVWKLIGNG